MKKILVAYASMAGSTADVAQVVGEEIARSGCQVDVLPLHQVHDLNGYDGVVIGGPVIMGWHREALRFLKKHRKSFQQIPLAVFVLAMRLTQESEPGLTGLPVYVDEELPKPPEKGGSLNFKERYARLRHYLQPILQATQQSRLTGR